MPEPVLKDADLTARAIGAFYMVYDDLGYGFLENVYCSALAIELGNQHLAFTREAPVDVMYRGAKVGHYRSDFIIENRLVIEVKASKALCDEHFRQVLNYLRATNLELALLLHFGPKPFFRRLIFDNHRKRAAAVTV